MLRTHVGHACVQLWQTLKRALGAGVWKQTLNVLTHGNITPPPGCLITDVISKRTKQITSGQRACGARSPVPCAVIDNSSRFEISLRFSALDVCLHFGSDDFKVFWARANFLIVMNQLMSRAQCHAC
jgi:hypothetical protein